MDLIAGKISEQDAGEEGFKRGTTAKLIDILPAFLAKSGTF
jgi:hypothetical protein